MIDNPAFILYYYNMENLIDRKKSDTALPLCRIRTKYPELDGLVRVFLEDDFCFSADASPDIIIEDGPASITLFDASKTRSETVARPFSREQLRNAAGRLVSGTAKAGFAADEKKLSALLGERSVRLPETEFRLYCELIKRSGSFVPAGELSKAVWGKEDVNLCTVYISYLRQKLDSVFGDGTLLTARGKGYRLRDI